MTSDLMTSTGAELTALRAALQFISDQQPQKWTIFSDSKVAMQPLLSPLRRGLYEQLVFHIAENLLHFIDELHVIAFLWLLSDCGIIGDERADRAAFSFHTESDQISIALFRSVAARKLCMFARKCTTSQ